MASDRKSIAILGTRGIPAQYGGFETFADRIGRLLVDAGHRVVVTCEENPRDTARAAEFRGVELRHVAAPRLGPLSTIVHDMLCLWRLRRETDVVYLLGYGAAFFAFVPRLFGREVWINPDGIEWKRNKWNAVARMWFRCMEWFTMRVPTRVIADAEALRELLTRRHRTSMPITTIAYGTDVHDELDDDAVLREHGLDRDAYFVVICRLEPENHVLEIIEGYARSGRDEPLIIVGDHTTGTSYVRKLIEHGQAHPQARASVRFIGVEFDTTRLVTLRRNARAYVHGHSVGGTNPSLLEALGAGAPVIAHDNPFNREVLTDVTAHWFTDVESAANAFRAVSALTRDEALLRCSEAQARARDAYDWSRVADRYRALLTGGDDADLSPAARRVHTSPASSRDRARR